MHIERKKNGICMFGESPYTQLRNKINKINTIYI